MKKTVLTFCAVVGLGLGAMAQGSAAWTPQATAFATPQRGISDIEIPSANVAWVIAYDGSGGGAVVSDFSRTSDGGNLWTSGSIGALASGYSFSNLSAINKDTAWVGMYLTNGAGGRILRTNNGGATWVQQGTNTFTNTSDSFLNIVHMFDANNGWAQGDPANGYFEMYTTTDGGTTWTRVPQANIPANLSGEYGTVDVYTTIGNTIYFGTNKGRVFKSTNGGLNWTLGGTTGLALIQDITFASATHGLIRNGADLRRTTDGGLTWQLVPYTGTLYGSDLTRVPGTTQTYVSTGAQTNASGSSYSLDGGTTWQDFDNGSQRTDVKFFSPTIGYAGGFNVDATTGGIFKYANNVNLTSVTTPTGINNVEFTKSVNVYPNPSTGIVNVEITNTTGNTVSVNAFDALGRNVYSNTAKLEAGVYNANIDLSHLGKGMYMLQVQNGENTSVRKIVIQ